ncbi:MAG: protein kinase [Planctomycetia bacterium]|nr:protein kinase [Planctomycetia bacterium]
MLSSVAADRGSFSLKEVVGIARSVTRQVRALHAANQWHGAIDLDAIEIEPPGRIRLRTPRTRRELGGPRADDSCPPELHGGKPVTPPADLSGARAALLHAGFDVDPRRIDVYQIGALIVRLATGGSVHRYLSSPKVNAQVPLVLRDVVDRSLGHNPQTRLADGDALFESLGKALEESVPKAAIETPARGSEIGRSVDTPSVPARPPAPSLPWVEPPDLPFDQLGQFQILARIGRGGMGDVYRAWDPSLGRQVAIKVLPVELARSEDLVRRFQVEATAAARLAHPNIVPIYFIGQDAGHHFFAMQFVEGESLADRLRTHERLSADETAAIAQQCLAALGAAHAQGLIHRDVKPGNILLDRQTGRAMLADFGLVHSLGESQRMTATGIIMGTVDYIAPEQARGQRVDGRADLYSLGVLMFRMLAGRLPFEAATPTAMIFQHAYEPPLALREVAPDVQKPLAAIVARLMAKNPEERYANCEAVQSDLEAFRAGKPLKVKPVVLNQSDIVPDSDIVQNADPATILPIAVSRPVRLPKHGAWRKVKDGAANLFWRAAPKFVQELQSTSLQVDRAIADYENRRDELARLVHEADAVAADFSAQAASRQHAAAAAARDAQAFADPDQAAVARRNAAQEARIGKELEGQLATQQRQAADLREQFAQADRQLGALQAQREALRTRLQAAEARWKHAGCRPKRAARPLVLAVCGACLLLGSLLAWYLASSSPQSTPSVPETLVAAAPVVPTKSTPAKAALPFWPKPLRLLPVVDPTVVVGRKYTQHFETEFAADWAGVATYSLQGDVPVGVTLDANRGLFHWTATADQAGKEFRFSIQVAAPDGSLDERPLTAWVLAPPNGSPLIYHAGTARLTDGSRSVLPIKLDARDPRSPQSDALLRPLLSLGPHDGDLGRIAMSPSGGRVAVSTNTDVHLWEIVGGDHTPDGQRLAAQPRLIKKSSIHKKRVVGLCFSPDERRLLSASEDGLIVISDVSNGAEIRVLDLRQGTMTECFPCGISIKLWKRQPVGQLLIVVQGCFAHRVATVSSPCTAGTLTRSIWEHNSGAAWAGPRSTQVICEPASSPRRCRQMDGCSPAAVRRVT